MNWEKIQFKEVVEFPPRISLEKEKEYDFIPMEAVDGGVKYVKDIRKKKYKGGGAKFGDGDTIFARITPCLENGKIVKAKDLEKGIGFGSTEYFVFRAKKGISNSDFIYYLAKSETIRQPAIKSMVGASGRQRADKGVVEEIIINLPPLPTQNKIASILSAYDDLIENNLKRINLLEEIAQNIYKEWFVHFRFPGYRAVKFNEDELPKGWDRKTLSQLCNSIEDGDWIESKDQNGSDYRLIQVSNIGVNSFVETNKWRWITEDTFNHLRCREIEDGDIIVSRMPNGIGRSWLVNKMDFRMVTVVDVAIVKPNLQLTSKYYLNEKFNSIENIQLCESLAGGTTRKRISKKTLASIEHLNPDKKILNNFDEVISSIYFLKSKLFKQNQILKEARDILLPRLMYRRIEV